MPTASRNRLLPALALLAGSIAAGAAVAQTAPSPAAPTGGSAAPGALTVELNRLETRAEGCRVWMLARNPGDAVDPLRLDLVIFGKDQVVARRLALDLGPLPAEKSTVRIFDLAGQACDGLGYILLNDVLACGPDAPAACLRRLAVSSRVQGVALEK